MASKSRPLTTAVSLTHGHFTHPCQDLTEFPQCHEALRLNPWTQKGPCVQTLSLCPHPWPSALDSEQGLPTQPLDPPGSRPCSQAP